MNWLSRVLDRLGLRPRGTGDAPWGDGFADEGWDAMLSATRWDRVSNDELVLLLPGLRRDGPAGPGDLGAEGRARLQPLVAAALARMERFPESLEPLRTGSLGVLRSAGIAIASRGNWPEAGLLEAAILSWEAGFNAAYLAGQAEVLHETLAASAWLGLVCRGRDALLPAALAAVPRELVIPRSGPGTPDAYGLVMAYLRARMDEARLRPVLSSALHDLDRGVDAPLVRGARGRRGSLVVDTTLAAALIRLSVAPTDVLVPDAGSGRRA